MRGGVTTGDRMGRKPQGYVVELELGNKIIYRYCDQLCHNTFLYIYRRDVYVRLNDQIGLEAVII